jgi:hypothetical protein
MVAPTRAHESRLRRRQNKRRTNFSLPPTHRSSNSRLGVWTKSARDSWTTFVSFDSVFGGANHFPLAIMEILVHSQFADSDEEAWMGKQKGTMYLYQTFGIDGASVSKRENVACSQIHQEMHQKASPVHSDSQLQRNQHNQPAFRLSTGKSTMCRFPMHVEKCDLLRSSSLCQFMECTGSV